MEQIIKSIKNWKRLYRYLKAYGVVVKFREFYAELRKNVKKIRPDVRDET